MLGGTGGNVHGEYRAVSLTTTFAPDMPLYSHVKKDRYIYFDPTEHRWEIGSNIHSLTTSLYASLGEIYDKFASPLILSVVSRL